MRSIAGWLLLASVHQEPVPSQFTEAGSCAHVTRPGTIPRGTPNGESGGSNSEERNALVAAIERANSRRVISMAVDFSVFESSVQTAPVKGSRRAIIPKFVVLHKVGTDGCRQGATDLHPYASISERVKRAQRYALKERLNSNARSNAATPTPDGSDGPNFSKAPGVYF